VDTKIDKEKDVNPHTVGLYDESSWVASLEVKGQSSEE
jgi:hypothetical protein